MVALTLPLSGCQTTPLIGAPPDVPACTNLGDHGWCRNVISKTSYFVDDGTGHVYMDLSGKMVKAGLFHDPLQNKNYSWAQLLSNSVVVPAYSFVKAKSWEDNVCHQLNCADGVGSWPATFQDLDDHLKLNFSQKIQQMKAAPHP